jgi:hypothetical protein
MVNRLVASRVVRTVIAIGAPVFASRSMVAV